MSSLGSETEECFVISHDRRCNSSSVALGSMSRSRCCGKTFIWSPDALSQLIPVSITSGLVFTTIFVLWDELRIIELIFFFLFLCLAQVSAFLLCSTDPGVYPRLRLSEVDPLEARTDLVYCRVCALRRPPRTAHCYECNVCVQEHDHHCGVLGGCVGRRSMRWFVLYLISISSACVFGVYWSIRSLFRLGPVVVKPVANHSVDKEGSDSGGGAPSNSYRGEDTRVVGIVVLFVILVLISLIVVCLTGYYIYLVATSTTRREAQKGASRAQGSLTLKGMVKNVVHIIQPPPSLLVEPVELSDALMV